MLTFLLIFCLLYFVFAVLGFTCKVTFQMMRWGLLAMLTIGGVVLTVVFTVPVLIVAAAAAVLFGIVKLFFSILL